MSRNVVARNKKAFHDYEIITRYEAGIVLKGSEVKALRAARVSIKESFIRIIKGEAYLLNAHFSLLNTTNSHYKPDEREARKLLLNSKEIEKLIGKTTRDGMTIVTLSIYFNQKNRAKVEIALAKGKQNHDKREDLKAKQAKRDTARAMKDY